MKKNVKIILCVAAAVLVVLTAISVIKLVKSGRFSAEEETSQPMVIDFEFLHKENIELTLGKNMFSFVRATDDSRKIEDGDFLFFSTDDNVVKIEFDHIEYDEYVYYKLTPVGVGTAQIYVRTADGSSVSEKITVTVTESNENSTEA